MWKVLALTFVLIASIIQSTVFVICDNFSNDRLVFAHVVRLFKLNKFPSKFIISQTMIRSSDTATEPP